MIRVGRCIYEKGKRIDPVYENFTPVVVLMKSSPFWELSPYYLTDNDGIIMENKWQFSKVYKKVPESKQTYSRFDQKVIWQHRAETHIENDTLNDKYWKWRDKGMKCKDAIRYPVGFTHRHECMYAIKKNKDGVCSDKLNYVESRKEIYVPEYCNLVQKQKKFKNLQKRLNQGENLLIIEVDGPKKESLPYYIGRYGVKKDFIENNTMLANEQNIKLMLNDDKNAFGHGYCLAMALLNKDQYWILGKAKTVIGEKITIPYSTRRKKFEIKLPLNRAKNKVKSTIKPLSENKTQGSIQPKKDNNKQKKTKLEKVVNMNEFNMSQDFDDILKLGYADIEIDMSKWKKKGSI